MKTINIKIIAASLLVFLGTVSCSDLLDQEPVSITHPDVFWVNQSNAEQALAGSYALFKETITYQANFIYWGELPGMTFMNSRNWISNYIEGSGNYVLAYRNNSINWKGFYRAANWANTIEGYVDGMDVDLFDTPAEKNRIIGEAAFVRALSYFYMARLWGDVPIITESIESSDQLITEDGFVVSVPQSDELLVLEHALEAANKAIDLLQYSNPGAPSWAITANKASAEALKAHITLWYASRDNNNADMIAQAIAATTSVINNSNAELIDYVAEGVAGFDDMCLGQSKTGLFEINNNQAMGESFRMSAGDAFYTGLTLNYPIWQYENSGVAPIIDPDFYGKQFMDSDVTRDNDVRKDLFFYDYESTENSFPLKYSHTSQDSNSEDAYAQFSESNILIFRLADMYLLRAEANARKGLFGLAIDDVNEIRGKAGSLDYAGTLDEDNVMKAIFDERAIEFVAEGQSAYDRIRMNYFEGVPWANEARNQKQGYFWPISTSIISINPLIVQPEYWRGAL